LDLDALDAEAVAAAAGLAGRFGKGDDHTPQAGRENRVDARLRLAVVRAGLESHVEGSATSPFTGVGQGHDFGVGPAVGGMVALAGKFSSGVDDYRADHRVRGSTAPPTGGEIESAIHPAKVGIVRALVKGASAGPDP
jgi:hypothetical protein